MTSAYGCEYLDHRVAQEGLDGLLNKPVTMQALFETVRNIFGSDTVPWAVKINDDAASGINGSRVLLVEDNFFNQEVAREILSGWGVSVTVAGNGQDAVNELMSKEFDAVLMDIQMPVMDGYEATALIRTSPELRELPVIAMTANAMASDRGKCMASGMNDYITKPIDQYELFSTLKKWISPLRNPGRQSFVSVKNRHGNMSVPVPSDLPGISPEDGIRLLSGDKMLYLDLLGLFLKTHAETEKELRLLIIHGDMEAASRLVHSMKSVSASIGAAELSEISGKLETAINAGSDDVGDLVDDFGQKLDIVIKGLASALNPEKYRPVNVSGNDNPDSREEQSQPVSAGSK